MGWKRTLVVLLVLGTLAIGLLQVGSANEENDIQLGENVEWVTLESVSFDPDESVDWEGSASIQTIDGDSHLVCDGLTQLFWEGAWTDVRVELKVQLGSGGFGIGVRSRPGEPGEIEFGCQQENYVLIRHPGVYLQSGDHNPRLDGGHWYSVVFVVVGDQLSVEVDGEIWFAVRDDDPNLTPGRIRIVANSTAEPILLDDIRVSVSVDEYAEESQNPQTTLNMGYAYLDEGNNEAAYEAFAEAAELFRAEGNKSGEAEALLHMGKALISTGDVLTAIDSFQSTVAILIEIGDRASEAWCYIDLGNAHMQLGDLTAALDYFESARAGFVALSDRAGEIEALRSEGHCLLAMAEGFRSTNPVEAISTVKRALRAFQDAGDEQGEGNALITLAGLYHFVSKNNEALSYAKQAESLFQSIGDRLSATWALNLQSSCHHDLSQYEQSLELGERALRTFRALGEVAGEAGALVSLSCSYEIRGEFQQAIDYCLTALDIFREIGQMDSAAGTLGRLGAYYSQVGETELAAECRRQSLELARMLDVPWLLADGLMSAGQSLMDQGNLTAAIVPLEEALGVYRGYESLNGEAACLAPLLDCYMFLGRLQEALACAESIVAIGQDIGNQNIECNGLMSLGNVQLRLGDLEAGTGFLEQSLEIAQEIGAHGMEGDLHRQLASCYWSLERLDDARMHFEEAIEAIERIFGELQLESLQSSFFPRVRDLYEEYLFFLLETGETRDAGETLWIAERSRARTYVERVATAGVDYLDVIPEAGIRSGVFDAETVERDARQIVQELPRNVAVIEYFVMLDRTLIWVVEDGNVHEPHEIVIARSALLEQVLEFRSVIETTSTGLMDAPDEETLRLSDDLYHMLIAPVEDQLDGIDHLIIVPSGSLYYLPFDALLDCPGCHGMDYLGGAYLVERFAVSYTPSLATLYHAWSAPSAGTADPRLLALADPATGDSSMLRLPEAQDEARAVAALFGQSEVHVSEFASEDVLRQSVEDVEFLLLSTHGVFDPTNPMYSYLMFSPTDTSDGRLHTYEVFELALQAELVTLSACETLLPALEAARDEVRAVRGLDSDASVALTDEQLEELVTGDDIVGLTRAFIYAGSSSVLSSLWRVVSETTEQLIVAFYGYMEEGMDKAAALRQAQLDVMAVYPHPRYWAAFNLMGDWR